MNVAIIGASDRSVLWRHGSLSEEEYEAFVHEYAKTLVSCGVENVIVTPDDGVYTDIAVAFSRLKQTKPIAYYPDQDTFYGYDHLKPNFSQYDTRPIGGDWYTLNADLTKQARTVLCLGFSPGALIELCFVKYHQKYGAKKDASLKDIRVIVDVRTIDTPLPAAVEEQIAHITYVSSCDEFAQTLAVQRRRQ